MSILIELESQQGSFTLRAHTTVVTHGVTGIYGPSGSGKTSLLRVLAGLSPASGRLEVNGVCWLDTARNLCVPTHERRIGMVFQEPSLLNHLTVAGNLSYAQSRCKNPLASAAQSDLFKQLNLHSLLNRHCHELSGGEQKRVAIARALLTHPQLLLLDEPTASLDQAHTQELLDTVSALGSLTGSAIFMVTHSVEELTRCADQVLILHNGQVQPARRVWELMSDINAAQHFAEEAGVVFEGVVSERIPTHHLIRIRTPLGELWAKDQQQGLGTKVRVRLLARDVSVSLAEPVDSSVQNRCQGQILAIQSDVHPAQGLLSMRVGEQLILARVTQRAIEHLSLKVGISVWLQFKSVALMT